MNLAYIRVSTAEQNDARQYEGLKKARYRQMVYREDQRQGYQPPTVADVTGLCPGRGHHIHSRFLTHCPFNEGSSGHRGAACLKGRPSGQ